MSANPKIDAREIAEAYHYCPLCGLERQSYEPLRPFRCHACGHTTFFGPVTAVCGIIGNDQGQVLLIERARDPGAGKLGMPGGFVDPNETAEASLEREIREEVGLKVKEMQFLMTYPNHYTYRGVTVPVLDIFYLARVYDDSQIRAEVTEVASWMWTKLEPSLLDRLAFHSNRVALEYVMKRESMR